MTVVDIKKREDRDTALVLATDRMALIAQTPETLERDAELRQLHAKLDELIEGAV